MTHGAHFGYYRVSTKEQSIEMQRAELAAGGITFEREFIDHGVSGATVAASRPAFAEMLKYLRKDDTLHVYAVDRLGRDAIDVQTTVKRLLDIGVTVNVRGLGVLTGGAGQIVLAVLAQVAELERTRIRERTEAGRELARKSLEATGKTHRGKLSMGRPVAADATEVVRWRKQNKASAAETARHFGISVATMKRYAAALKAQEQPGDAGKGTTQDAATHHHHEGTAA